MQLSSFLDRQGSAIHLDQLHVLHDTLDSLFADFTDLTQKLKDLYRSFALARKNKADIEGLTDMSRAKKPTRSMIRQKNRHVDDQQEAREET